MQFLCRYITNVEISNNRIQGLIVCYNCNGLLKITNNFIDNGGIYIQELYGWNIDNVSILDNKISNSYINIQDVDANELEFEGNKLENTNVSGGLNEK